MKQGKIVVGISHGDINGVGYEVIIKALQDNRLMDMCIPIVYGSPKVAGYHRKALDVEGFSFNIINSAKDAHPNRPNIINCIDENIRVELGLSTKVAGESSALALQSACRDLDDGLIDVLVTAPIDKFNIQSDSFKYPGHTEYLKEVFDAGEVVMLMVSNNLKVGVVTGHISHAEVSKSLDMDTIINKIHVLHDSLKQDFGLRKPKIAVLGLNPHAGDKGLLGEEEEKIISPAIETVRKDGIMAFGPYPADGHFGSGGYANFDATLAMYHDQGLTPFKTIAYDEGVNYTAGLQVIRTSPAHGTAFDIAGKNEANGDSFRAAIYLACDVYKNRTSNEKLEKDAMDPVDIAGE